MWRHDTKTKTLQQFQIFGCYVNGLVLKQILILFKVITQIYRYVNRRVIKYVLRYLEN